MTNDDILELMRRCDLSKGKVLIPNQAYLFHRDFRLNGFNYEDTELIVLVKSGIKAGGIYRMGSYDMHWIIKPKFRGQHILSDFFRTGIINEIWPENKSVKLCEVYSESEYKKKKHLADILGLSIKNQEEIESFLSYVENQKKKHYNQVN